MAAQDVKVYELFYLVGDSKEAELPAVREEVEKIVKGVGGVFLPEETEEKRNLAYEIRKERRGTYVARRFTLPTASDEPFSEKQADKENAIDSVTRQLGLYSSVLRFLIVRAERLPELKAIPREERPKPTRREDRRGGGRRFERSDRRSAPVRTERPETSEAKEESVKEETKETKVAKTAKPAAKKVTQEDLDKQLKEVLDI
ncbi:MAG: 30S ribosomal protein S6 [Candidatus Moranbacteria bacterium]|nr:30S ribosomal protein S6 [Candidatus Moranbacteria bacterium]NTW46201.1 30S ribosomal protein S6 [Candidatus Moranbacteria bacterium]